MAKKEKKNKAATGKRENAAPSRETDAQRENGKKLSRKERKQQKKARIKQQLELEKQLVADGKIPARNKYRARSFFGRAVAFCLVFLFGIVSTVGAFLGFGAFAPAKDVFWLIGVDYKNFISEEYASDGIVGIVRSILGDINNNSFDSLQSIAKYTPIIDNYTETIIESLSKLGIDVDADTLKTTKFEDLGTYLRDDVLGNVELGKALNVTPSEDNRMMVAICYGNKGVDYNIDENGNIVPITPPVTLKDLTSSSNSVIERVSVEDAFGVTASSNQAMRFLAYGTEGLNYEIVNGKIVMLKNKLTGEFFQKKTIANLTSDGSTPLETAKVSDLVTVESTDGLLGVIKDWTINDLKTTYRIERLRIDQVMTIGDDASPIARAIKNWRLCDITDPEKMDSLKLGDIISIDENSPPILKAIQNTQIGDLSDAVDGLRLSDILEEDDIAGNNFLKPLKLSPLTSLGDDLKKLSAADVFGAEMYSYLDPKENDDMSFYELYEAYRDTGRKDKDASGDLPKAHTLAEGEAVRSYYVHGSDGVHLVHGFFKNTDAGLAIVPENDVHTRKTTPVPEGPEAVTYYTTGEQKLTPSYEWRYIDYENAPHVKPLPEGDEIGSDPAKLTEYTKMEGTGEPYLDTENENLPYYYFTTGTTRVHSVTDPETGRVTMVEETGKVAYPLMKDENGIYYSYVKYTPNGGAAEFSEVRVDLEEEIASYTYQEDGETVTLTKNTAGKWTYTVGDEEPQKIAVNVYTHAEETDPETGEVTVPAYDYIKTEIEVLEGYYAEPAEGEPIGDVYLDGENVTEKFEIVTLVEGEVTGEPIEVERYLSGVWFFLFAEENAEKTAFIDNAAGEPVLDLTDVMGNMGDTLSNTELWQLFFHGLLTSNPFVEISAVRYPDGINVGGGEGESKFVTNLNECTVAETITLVNQLLNPAGEP